MFKISLAELKEKIITSKMLTPRELDARLKQKINELSGLISEEGAAHIIANELGIEVVSQNATQLKIKEVYVGMRSVTVLGKVVRKFEVNQFSKGEMMGKVCSLVLGDETATIRVVFWNEQVDLLEKVQEEDILLVKNSYVRENRGAKEIHLGNKGEIEINPEGKEVAAVRERRDFVRKEIGVLQGGEQNVEIIGTVVQVFDPRFFLVHPETGKRLREGEAAGVVPEVSYVMNAVLDDGTGNIRCVFWKNQTNHLVGVEDLSPLKDQPGAFETMKTDLLGEQLKLMGKVQRNEMFERVEFIAQIVQKADPQEELKRLEKVV